MIELLTTPKVAILFAIISTIVLDVILTMFITMEGLPFISSLAFSTPLSIVVVAGMMIAGAVVFHAHKQINK